jgi:hypothetical protein
LLRTVFSEYRPQLVVAAGQQHGSSLPLLAERQAVGGKATAYVCRRFVCAAPTSDPEELARQLARNSAP